MSEFNWGYAYWAGALLFIAFFLFAIPEAYAIITGRIPTFSFFMARIRASAFGMIWVFLWGQLVGGLLIHFSGWCMSNVEPYSFGSSYIHNDTKHVGK